MFLWLSVPAGGLEEDVCHWLLRFGGEAICSTPVLPFWIVRSFQSFRKLAHWGGLTGCTMSVCWRTYSGMERNVLRILLWRLTFVTGIGSYCLLVAICVELKSIIYFLGSSICQYNETQIWNIKSIVIYYLLEWFTFETRSHVIVLDVLEFSL